MDQKLCNYLLYKLYHPKNIKYLHYDLFQNIKLDKKDSNIKVGLINVACKGFGDIINCKTFSDYLKSWYPNIKFSICTSSPEKFKSLGISTNKLTKIEAHFFDPDEGSECQPFSNLKFSGKVPKFDLIIVVPMVGAGGEQFSIREFKKFIPYATEYNTFTVSEYNGDYPPYTFPTGIGKHQLGLMLTDMKIKKHNLIKGPYALAYTAGHDTGCATHTNLCILSFIELICNKYKDKKKLQLIIPPWFCSGDKESEISLLTSPQLKKRCANIIKKYFGISYLVLKGDTYSENSSQINIVNTGKNKNEFILRGDILPKPREEFISLIKYSLPDVLLTGDQSLTDGIAYSNSKKIIWYQVCGWKIDLAHQLAKEVNNKYLDNFRTSCGTLKGLHINQDNKKLIKNNDFRKKGKVRMDSILKFHSLRNEPLIKILIECINHSRTKESTMKKFIKQVKLKYKL